MDGDDTPAGLQDQERSSKVKRTKEKVEAITLTEYKGWQGAYAFFNERLFADCPLGDQVMIVLQRHAHSKGHYAHGRYGGRASKDEAAELCLNPDAFVDRTDEQILSTLVHEMVHRWQQLYGKVPSRGYHDKQWAAKMESVGLMPSTTGAVGGKRTGKNCTHYILPEGRFSGAYAVLAASGFKLHWQSSIVRGKDKAPPSKVKFTCPSCFSNVWGKPNTKVTCGVCYPDNPIMVTEEQMAQRAMIDEAA
jgi:SprT-like family